MKRFKDVLESLLPCRFVGGHICKDIIAAIPDVTKVAERAIKSQDLLQKSQNELFVALSSAGLSSWTFDVREQLYTSTHTNNVIGERTTFDQLQLMIHPQDRRHHAEMFGGLSSGHKSHDSGRFRVVDKSGATRWYEVHAIANMVDEHGKVLTITGSQKDVTDEVDLARESDESRIKLSLSLSAGDLIPWEYVLGEGQITYTLNHVTGLKTIAVDDYMKLIHLDDRSRLMRENSKMIVGNADKAVTEFRVLVDDKYHWFSVISTVFKRDSNGGVAVLTGLGRDISETIRSRDELILLHESAEKSSEQMSAFIANVSHEIRNPLNAIIGFSSLMLEAENRTQMQEYFNIIKQNNELLLTLISDTLDISRIESGKMIYVYSDVDVNALMASIAQMFELRVSGDVEVVLEPSQQPVVLRTDPNRVTQVIANLMGNAVKFTTRGTIRLGYEDTADGVYFYVKDTGPGIPIENIARVFDRFVEFNTVTKGTGLGLSISKKIVDHLSGKIGVESQPGVGSKFWFVIPHKNISVLS